MGRRLLALLALLMSFSASAWAQANKPFVLDVHVDAEVRPPSTGAWELPPTPYKEPVFGERFIPDMTPAK